MPRSIQFPTSSYLPYLLDSTLPIVPAPRGLPSSIVRHSKLAPTSKASPRPLTCTEPVCPFGKWASHRHKYVSYRTPYSVIFVVNAFSICTHLTNVRPTRAHHWLSQACLPPSLRRFLRAPPLLAGKAHQSGARGVPFTALILTQVACPRL
jgi:hypothetical protein